MKSSRQDSILFPVRTRVLGRDRTLRRDKASCSTSYAMGGRRQRRHQQAHERASASNEELMLVEQSRTHAPSGRWCSDKIRRMAGTLDDEQRNSCCSWPGGEYITRGMVDNHGPSDEFPRCETGHGVALRETQISLRQGETARHRVETSGDIPLTPATITTTAPATTSASTSVLATATSKPTLDAQTPATDVPMQATDDQSGGIKPLME